MSTMLQRINKMERQRTDNVSVQEAIQQWLDKGGKVIQLPTAYAKLPRQVTAR